MTDGFGVGQRRLEDRSPLPVDLDVELAYRPRLVLDDADADEALDRVGLVEENAGTGEQVLERFGVNLAAAGGDVAVPLRVLPGAVADGDVEVAPVPRRPRAVPVR